MRHVSPIGSKIDFWGDHIFVSAARLFVIILKFIFTLIFEIIIHEKNSLTSKKFHFQRSIFIKYLLQGIFMKSKIYLTKQRSKLGILIKWFTKEMNRSKSYLPNLNLRHPPRTNSTPGGAEILRRKHKTPVNKFYISLITTNETCTFIKKFLSQN